MSEQLVQHSLARGMEEFDELAGFLERLSLPDITQEFEEGALGYGDEYIRTPCGKLLQSASLG